MKSFQKRYVYAALVAGVVFLLIYLMLDFSLLISLLLTILIYIGGIFFFKEKDVREFNADDINRYYFQTSKILSYKDRIDDIELKEDIEFISDVSSKILSSLTQKPKKVTQVYNFFDYYMNLVIKMLEKYVYLKTKTEYSDIEKTFLDRINIYFENIKQQFSRQLDNMYKTQRLNMQAEIEAFEKVCAIEGLDKEVSKDEQ